MTVRANPDLPGDSAAIRRRLRAACLAAREQLAGEDRAARSAALESHLSSVLASLPPGSIGFCAPVRGEFDAMPLLARLVAGGWRAAMPVVEASAAPMRFRPWTPGARMAADRHGIPIPDTVEMAPPPGILLLPLVAFDAAGYRLGYGGGFFDRTLAACLPRPFAIGVGFELARVDSVLPQTHDQRCDAIVTEAGWQGNVPSLPAA